MSKDIYPGNWVNRMSSGHGGSVPTGVRCLPGRTYYEITGYALITTAATVWDVILPSPDMRPDDKPRADTVGLVLPAGARVYSVGLRIPDMRPDRSIGTAFTGLVGTNTNKLKLADDVATAAAGGITTAVVTTQPDDLVCASTTWAPGSSRVAIVTPAILAAQETLKVFSVVTAGAAVGSSVSSSLVGGTPLICEVFYYVEDKVADLGDVRTPFLKTN
jgi:hypothetical protein